MSRNSTSSNFRVEGQVAVPSGQEPYTDYRVVILNTSRPWAPRFTRAALLPSRIKRMLRASLSSTRRCAPLLSAGRRRRPPVTIGDEKNKPLEIVGVASDIKDEDIDDEAEPGVYVPFLQDPWWTMSLVVRTSSDPKMLASAAQREVRALDADLPLYNVRTMTEVIDEAISPKRLVTFLLGFFALAALLLAAVGLYAVMSYTVAQRTHEIGIRMALGAQASHILRMVVGQGLLLTVIGVCLGLLGAFAVTRVMAQRLYRVTATDPVTFAGISLLLTAVALVASFIPARRATRVDPMVALRDE